jgi:hypothetical protein
VCERDAGLQDDVHIDDAGEIAGRKTLDADGATAPETLRHQEPCRQDDLERDAQVRDLKVIESGRPPKGIFIGVRADE